MPLPDLDFWLIQGSHGDLSLHDPIIAMSADTLRVDNLINALLVTGKPLPEEAHERGAFTLYGVSLSNRQRQKLVHEWLKLCDRQPVFSELMGLSFAENTGKCCACGRETDATLTLKSHLEGLRCCKGSEGLCVEYARECARRAQWVKDDEVVVTLDLPSVLELGGWCTAWMRRKSSKGKLVKVFPWEGPARKRNGRWFTPIGYGGGYGKRVPVEYVIHGTEEKGNVISSIEMAIAKLTAMTVEEFVEFYQSQGSEGVMTMDHPDYHEFVGLNDHYKCKMVESLREFITQYERALEDNVDFVSGI